MNLLIVIPVLAFALVGFTVWILLSLDLMQGNRTAHKALQWPIAVMPIVLIVMLFIGVLA